MTDRHIQERVSSAVIPPRPLAPPAPPDWDVAPPHPLADPPTERDVVMPVRRIRGLRLSAIPSANMAAQTLGGVAVIGGVWWQFGGAIALIVGGLTAAVLGALHEAGKV